MPSQEVVRPSAITGLKADLIEAVTNAYMAKRVPELTGLKYDHGECKDGEFRYKSPSPDNVFGFSLERDVGYYCSYPGGVWREDVLFAPDSEKSSDDSTYGTGSLFDAKGTYAMIESEVSSWIDPWADCHSPNEFANQINSIANVASQLYVGNEIVLGGQDVSPVGGDASSGASAVSDVRSAIDEVKLGTDDMRGPAIDAFQRTYVLDIERTLGGQRGLATAAGLAVTAEATAWNQTYISLRDFIKKAIHDFNDFAGAHGASGENIEATLGAVAAVAGLAAATGGVAFPPFGVVMGVVGGVATVGGLMFPATDPVNPAPLALGGGDYMAYWTAFKDGIKAINTDLETAENAITKGCHRMLADYHAYPDNYSIAQGQLGTAGRPGRRGPLPAVANRLQPHQDAADRRSGGIHRRSSAWLGRPARRCRRRGQPLITRAERVGPGLVAGGRGHGQRTQRALRLLCAGRRRGDRPPSARGEDGPSPGGALHCSVAGLPRDRRSAGDRNQ